MSLKDLDLLFIKLLFASLRVLDKVPVGCLVIYGMF